MLTSVVLILAGVTAWCVASLALALIVGPIVRRSDRRGRAGQPVVPLPVRQAHPITGAIPMPLAR